MSNAFFGFIAKRYNLNASFVGLALVALAGGVMLQMEMGETRPNPGGHEAA